jgi:hypothetical protein
MGDVAFVALDMVVPGGDNMSTRNMDARDCSYLVNLEVRKEHRP